MDLESLAEALRLARRHRDSLAVGTREWREAQLIVERLLERMVRLAAIAP